MYCSNCGHEIKKGDLFCENCGTKIEVKPEAAAQEAPVAAAVETAKRPSSEGKTIVVLLPDSGDRYYSTKLSKY